MHFWGVKPENTCIRDKINDVSSGEFMHFWGFRHKNTHIPAKITDVSSGEIMHFGGVKPDNFHHFGVEKKIFFHKTFVNI